MIRAAQPEDDAALRAFLAEHIETSMFLLGNLEAHGIGNMSDPHGTRYLLHHSEGRITGVFGCTNGGYLMCQHPGVSVATARAYLGQLAGRVVQGITGAADQVAVFLQALPFASAAWHLDRVEPLFSRAVTPSPPPAACLRAPTGADKAMLESWFAAHLTETGFHDASSAPTHASDRAQAAIASGRTRLLDGPDRAPVGMTSINARAGDAVQIGGVHVLPDWRGRGYAGQMVAAHLAELHATGIRRAILFAASDAAARAYRRIGFTRVGTYRVAILRQPCLLHAGGAT